MNAPASLPAQIYLLHCLPGQQRIAEDERLPYLLRAAALVDLLLHGRIADQEGTVRVVSEERLGDPLLDDLLREIARSQPKKWVRWVGRPGRTKQAVRDALEAGRWIRIEPSNPLPIVSTKHVKVRDERVVKRLTEQVSHALTAPLAEVGEREAALAVLVAAGEVDQVLPREERHKHQDRLARLADRCGLTTPALRGMLRELRSFMTAVLEALGQPS